MLKTIRDFFKKIIDKIFLSNHLLKNQDIIIKKHPEMEITADEKKATGTSAKTRGFWV